MSTQQRREDAQQQQGAARGRAACASPVAAVISAGVLIRRVRQSVNAAERMICGAAAVHSSSVAEGLAISGTRAACLLEPEKGTDLLSENRSVPFSASVPWVAHRIRRNDQLGPMSGLSSAAFELSASTPQQAVDHCLVAHRLSARLGRPGVCSIDPELADMTAAVRLPESDWIAKLPDVAPRTGPHSDLDTEKVARIVFDELSATTGRAIGCVSQFEMVGARYVILAAGSLGRVAEQTAIELRRSGIACGAAVLALLRPFPADRIRELCSAAEEVAVLSSDMGEGDDALAMMMDATLARCGVRTRILRAPDDRLSHLSHELGNAWSTGDDWVATGPGKVAASIVIGGLPGRPEMEALLLDAVGWIAQIATPTVDAYFDKEHRINIVTVGGSHSDEHLLDLLVASNLEALDEAHDNLERIRECGSLLLRATTDDPNLVWAALCPDHRATIIRRRVRLCLIPPVADHSIGMQAAILASVPGIARTIGLERDVRDMLQSLEPSESTSLARLLAAARTIVKVDPASLSQPGTVPSDPTAAPRQPLLLPEQRSSTDAAKWRTYLREFHFGGNDVRRETGPAIPSALMPAVFESRSLTTDTPNLQSPQPTLFEAWTNVVLENRRKRRRHWLDEAGTLAERMREILGLPTGSGARDAACGMSALLGHSGSDFVDPQALADKLVRRREPTNIPPERHARISHVLDALEGFLRDSVTPMAYAICSEDNDETTMPGDVERLGHPDALRAAVGLFEGLAHVTVERARAMRIARLETGNSYDAVIHGPTLDRLDWRSLTVEELQCVPAVVVLETAQHLRGPALSALSELIRAGRPLQVLVSETLAGLFQDALSGYHPGLGYLAVAHREALVIQSSTAHPEHLHAALERASATLDPVVIISAIASEELPAPPRLQLQAALQARATPCLVYDPSGGTDWADRFSLDGNPQADRSWPAHEVAYQNHEGHDATLVQSITFAHAAALDPALRSHFRVIGPDAWLDDQVSIDAYLDLADRDRAKSLPYLWVIEAGKLCRAVMSWEMAFACRDRARAWHILQELAGTDNAYARRATDEARQAAAEETARTIATLETEFATRLESARAEGATAAVERLVRVMTGSEGIGEIINSMQGVDLGPEILGDRVPPLSQPAPLASVSDTRVSPANELPYIDSFLCTTCNECTNLNPQMFHYNENKQAEIGDPSAGSFKQLVKAAETCPARCIHPGQPRAGDKTATPALITRAAKFQ